MYLTVKGLILRITNYNDTDAILNILTSTHGKLAVKARGLRRKNSSLSAPCQLLAYTEFVLFEYKGMYTINEARNIELFHSLRSDLHLFRQQSLPLQPLQKRPVPHQQLHQQERRRQL